MKNKQNLLLVLLLVSFAGCQKKNKATTKAKTSQVATNIDIPTAENSYFDFDEELGEFTLADNGDKANDAAHDADFTWEDADQKRFQMVYFDFDRHSIREDQRTSVAYNAAEVKKTLEDAQKRGLDPIICIDGHADHAAGSATYNLALSEKRAAALRTELIKQGIPQENIKIVGRGKEVPAIVNGKPVTGNRQQQWPNRRDELRVVLG